MGKQLHPNQKNITIWVTEEEKLRLMEKKGNKPWRDFLFELLKCCEEK